MSNRLGAADMPRRWFWRKFPLDNTNVCFFTRLGSGLCHSHDLKLNARDRASREVLFIRMLVGGVEIFG